MLLLSPFRKISDENENELAIKGDFSLLNQDTIKFTFSWRDPKLKINFASTPENGRYFKLWESTCFEAFFQVPGLPRYFEVNLSPRKAWNVFVFSAYRTPQPPTEYEKVDLIDFVIGNNEITATFKFTNENFKTIRGSICAVVKLKSGEMTYWSNHHADEKPNFHHFNSFIIERKFS